MATISYLSGGESPLAAQMNSLFEEFDRRVGLMLSDRSFLLLPPARRTPLTGLLGQCFYFLSATAPNFRSYGWPSWTGASFAWSAVTYPRDKRHALAELIIENPDTAVVIPDAWTYYDTFRIHNLGRASVTVQLDSETTIEVPAWGCRTARRTGGAWLTGWKYFQKFTPGDPRCWYYSASPGFASNVMNPTILINWVAAFEGRQWVTSTTRTGSGYSNIFLDAVIGSSTPAAQPDEVGRFEGARWQADPALALPDMTEYDALYTALGSGAKVEDIMRHPGDLLVLDAGSVEENPASYDRFTHTGFGALVAGMAGVGVTVTRNGSGDVVFTGAGLTLQAETTNLLGYQTQQYPRPWLQVPLPLTADMRITRAASRHTLAPVDRVGVYGYGDNPTYGGAGGFIDQVMINVDSGRTSLLGTARANGQTVGELLELNWLWTETGVGYPAHASTDQDTDWGTHTGRSLLRTPVGHVLTTNLDIGAYLLGGGWLPKQQVFPGRLAEELPLVTVNEEGVTVRSFIGLNDGAWPALDSGAETLWLSPRIARIYGYKTGRSAPFVEKPSTAEYDLIGVNINRQVPLALAQRLDPAGTGFGWWRPNDSRDVFGDLFKVYRAAEAARPAGNPDIDTVLVGPLLHEHYNLLAWRVNSLAVYDPLDLQDLRWPLVGNSLFENQSTAWTYTPHLTGSGLTGVLEWTGIIPNYFPGPTRWDHYAGWANGDGTSVVFNALAEDLTGFTGAWLTPADVPAIVDRFDERLWHYEASVTWAVAFEYRSGGSGPYRRGYTGVPGISAVRGSLSKWLNEWNEGGDPAVATPHRLHQWAGADALASLAATAGVAFRHVQTGMRYRMRSDELVPDISDVVPAEYSAEHLAAYAAHQAYYGLTNSSTAPDLGRASIVTSWSDEGHGSRYVGDNPGGNSSADAVPNSAMAGLTFLGGQALPDPAGDMLDKVLLSGYPSPGWLLNPRTVDNQPFPQWSSIDLVQWGPTPYTYEYGHVGSPSPAVRLRDVLVLNGPWSDVTGSLGGLGDGTGLCTHAYILGPFTADAMYTAVDAKKNFSVIAWGTVAETLRRQLDVTVDSVPLVQSAALKFTGTFSEEQWGALYQVFQQGVAF